MAVVLTISSLTSCRDDAFSDSGIKDGRLICFSLDATGSFEELTRSNDNKNTIISHNNITLISGQGDKLYLSSVETDGILKDKGGINTRGSLSTTTDINSFGVFARLKDVGSLYMSNVKVSESGNVWMPEKEYLWPGNETLHFNAYSPYMYSAEDEGITTLPELDDNAVLNLGFTTPENVESQFDLMYAIPTDADSSPCALTFNHALTGIRFAAGSEMTPCVIKEITISGVSGTGTLNLETGEWSDLKGSSSYSVKPDITMTAAQDSQFVLPETSLTGEDGIMLLIPQTLGEDAQVSMTVETNGETSSFKASLVGQKWTAGKTVTYHISVNPVSSSLILEAVDENGARISSISPEYFGGEHSFRILSHYNDKESGSEIPVEWDAVIVDSEGNQIEAPDWILSYNENGNGDSDCLLKTWMPAPKFISMNEHTSRLRSASDINVTSEQSRFNLASESGGESDENTANSYIINAPGNYRFPLVYGNAIKNGTANTSSYISTLSHSSNHNKTTLYNFVNHLGNAITDPYIYNNSGCDPASAEIIWSDGADIVRNVALSEDKKYVDFDIPASSIRQGNAMVAVKDAQGNIMWSWHLWISDIKVTENMVDIPNPDYASVVYGLLSCNLGHIFGGDVTEFDPEDIAIRFTQKNVPDGEAPLSYDLKISQASVTFTMSNNHPFYQWGRKDPMFGGADQYFDAGNKVLDISNITTMRFDDDNLKQIETSIQYPSTFFVGEENYLISINPFYRNLWDINLINASASGSNPQNIKTIYDPCPVGSKVPIGNSFIVLSKYKGESVDNSSTKRITLSSTSETLDFTSLGYRQYDSGKFTQLEDSQENTGPCSIWSATSGGRAGVAHYMCIHNDGAITMETFVTTLGYGIRPAKD